jgi:DASH complex subunit DAD2
MASNIRASHAASASSQTASTTAAATAKLLEKKKEYDAVCALERASTLFLERIEGLGEDFDIMANAGEGESSQHQKCRF